MQRTSRHLLLLPLIIAGIVATLTLSIAPNVYADNTQVSVGVGETTLTITGQTSPGTFVTVLKDSTPIGSTSADSTGSFSLDLTFATGGINLLSLYGTTTTGSITDRLTASINVVEHENTLFYAFLPPTISLDKTGVAINTDIHASGASSPGSTVTITTDTGAVTQATADSSGNWSAAIRASLAGLHSLIGIAQDGLGQQSAPTRLLSFLVTGPTAPQNPPAPITPIAPSPATRPPIITSPQDNQYVNSRTVTVKGSADPGDLVEIWVGSKNVGSAYASASGSWQMTFSLTSPHSILRARTCRSGACSDFSPPINVFFSAGLPGESLFSTLNIGSLSLSAYVSQQLELPLVIQHGAAPYRVTVEWGDHTTDHKTYAKAGKFILKHAYASPGFYNGTVTVKDANNVEDILHFAVHISDHPLSSRLAPPVGIFALIIAVFLAIKFLLPILALRRGRRR